MPSVGKVWETEETLEISVQFPRFPTAYPAWGHVPQTDDGYLARPHQGGLRLRHRRLRAHPRHNPINAPAAAEAAAAGESVLAYDPEGEVAASFSHLAEEGAVLLPSIDDLFTSQEKHDSAAAGFMASIPVGLIDSFPNHPFRVANDEEMGRSSRAS